VFHLARNGVLFLAILFWLGLAYWVYRDARRRMDDPWLVATATLLGLVVPYVGAMVYLLFRPPETLADARSRELEVWALEERLVRNSPRCPTCRAEVEPSFLVCPVCATQLKEPCARCSAPLEPLWQACPYCATPVGATVAAIEPAAADLDAALTAEAAATTVGNGKPKGGRAGGAPKRTTRPAA
jgi:hypothetical protein